MNSTNYNNNLITLLYLKGLGTAHTRKFIDQISTDLTIDDLQSLIHETLGIPYTKNEIQLAKDLTKRTLDICDKKSITIITGSKLPSLLTDLKNPPLILYCLGSPPNNFEETITVIGTRSPSSDAISATELISEQIINKGNVIVSGMALGVDTIAQQYSVIRNHRTIAILGSDVLDIYPPKNVHLAKSIIDNQGCLLSEYAPHTKMQSYMLVARDRIQAGISKKLILIQSKVDGGSMHATKEMIRIGRSVYFVDYDSVNISKSEISGNLSLKNNVGCEGLSYSDIVAKKDIFKKTYRKVDHIQQDSFNFSDD